MSKTKEEWQAIAATSIHTGKMANTLAKALAKRYSKRWQFVDFLGPNGRESAGIVDILAIRKSGGKPSATDAAGGLKRLDLFEIIVIQVKGGTAPKPSAADINRMRLVNKRYHGEKIVLFQWEKGNAAKTGVSVLRADDTWVAKSTSELFGA